MSQHSLHDDVVARGSGSERAATSRDSSHSGEAGLGGGSSHQPDAVITVFAPPATESHLQHRTFSQLSFFKTPQ